MKIEVYVMARNEEKMIPYIMRHYGMFANVIFIESNSSDRTVELATELGATVMKYDMKDELSDQTHVNIKNECWKGSTADWVIMVDADEFVYHPEIVSVLSKIDATVIQPSFHNMFSYRFPTTKGQIYDEVKFGTADGGMWRSKPIIFSPLQITSMNWFPGSHYANPQGNVKYSYDSGIKLLHMRFLSREYVYEHYNSQAHRLCKENRDNGWAVQYDWDKKEIDRIFNETQIIKIV